MRQKRISVLYPAFAIAIAVAVVGCSRSPSGPKTYPVKGTVKFADGQPVTDGNITFSSKTQGDLPGFAMIKSDGSFSLTTTINGKPTPGAVTGEYSVKVMLFKAGDVQPEPLPPIELPETLTVKESDNNFNIILRFRPPK